MSKYKLLVLLVVTAFAGFAYTNEASASRIPADVSGMVDGTRPSVESVQYHYHHRPRYHHHHRPRYHHDHHRPRHFHRPRPVYHHHYHHQPSTLR